MAVFWDVAPCRLAEVASVNTSETSVNFYQTTLHNIPEDSHLHTRRRENLKSHVEHALASDAFLIYWAKI
jgi:hypothetical protein